MKHNIQSSFVFLLASLSSPIAWAQEEEPEDIFTLSPFTINAEEDTGYRAGSTLAGTRLRTELKDVGAAVSVYTEEFLTDIDATSLEEALKFTTSTEVAGIDGNFSGGFSGENNVGARVEAAQTNRVRGLAEATLTRNYFTTDIPFDSYNSKQLTIVRGPNAVLAGAGSPGGIIDGSVNNAAFKEISNLSVRFGSMGSYRQTLSLNRVLFEDRLAVRLDLLNENRKFRQEPANEKDRRYTFSTNAILRDGESAGIFGRTTFRGSYESGKISGTPPDPLPPMMSTSGWFSETEAGKWYLNAHERRRLAGSNASGSFSPGQVIPAGGFPEGWVEGFPLYAQLALVFADPGSSTASVGLSGNLASIQGFQGVSNPGGGFFRGTGDPNRSKAGFSRTRLLDRNVFDFYNNLLTGAFDYQEKEFDATNIALEQLFLGGKAGVEIAYDDQDYFIEHDIPIAGDDTEVFIDVNRTLSVRDNNEQPILNPNFSRPFIVTRDAFSDVTNDRQRETRRVTGFIGHDFREGGESWWRSALGKHTLSALYQKSEYNLVNESFKSSWNRDASGYDISPSAGEPGTFRSQVNAWFYIGGPTIDLESQGDIRLTPIDTARPEFGESYDLQVYTGPSRTHRTITAFPERITAGYRENKETFESASLSHQAHFFSDHLVTLFSYREDESERSIGEFGTERDSSTNGDLTRAEFIVLEDPALKIGSWTKSIVGLFPEDVLFELPLESELRFFWNESENFTPAGARRNIYNRDVGPPQGQTEEFGFNLSTMRGKLDFRATWYETKVVSSSVSAGGNPYSYIQAMATRLVDAHNAEIDINDSFYGWDGLGFNSFSDAAFAFFEALPSELAMGPGTQFEPSIDSNGDGTFSVNPDSIPQLASISDTVSEGVELEAIFNPTKSWRISVSASKQEALRAGVGALEIQFAEAFLSNMEAAHGPDIFQASRNPAIGQDAPWLAQYRTETLFPIRAEAAKSGTLLPEMPEWKANIVTRYQFREGALKGFHIGGAVTWTDEKAVGYPNTEDAFGNTVADVANPFYTSDRHSVSVNCGYKRRLDLFGQKVDWNARLAIGNALGDDELIVTKINPDGSTGQVRVPPERIWSITNEFKF
ncbi:hypothetical protein QEH56_14865 [Pelagicoccus enzymogenes]|uniref:TonB-dependent receptor plug domain-containing protein n=1 Tax=Pelagicoccus enzymogenes TaxID=2773457 RepID=UPI00280F9285|nr:TonB-dependent receptor plug domain-containing protein [Pelagicoccus enzymogenes]MDQ8199446.1 hypothetical protein [Pelagicoccus enzymogenes]